jgi:hypothetical protein
VRVRIRRALSRWNLRWGIVHFTSRTWKWPGYKLTLHEHWVGFRCGAHGWLIMPLHRLADRLP